MIIPEIQAIAEIIGAIGALAAAIGYLVSQYTKGKKDGRDENIKAQTDLMTNLQAQIGGYQKVLEDNNRKLIDMDKQNATFKAIIEEKDKTIEKYLKILENRSPELENTLKALLGTMNKIEDFMHTHIEGAGKDMKIEGTITTHK